MKVERDELYSYRCRATVQRNPLSCSRYRRIIATRSLRLLPSLLGTRVYIEEKNRRTMP